MPESEVPAAFAISGGGTTMKAILDEISGIVLKGKVRPRLIVCSNPLAGGIKKASDWGIPEKDILVTHPRFFPSPSLWAEFILENCHKRRIQIWGQYGWSIFTPVEIVQEFEGWSINQHPGPLRYHGLGFGGKGMLGTAVHSAVLHFARSVSRDFPFTEAVSQRVAENYDEGALLDLEQVPILPKDDVSSLKDRVLQAEYTVQIRTLLAMSEGRVVEIDPPALILPREQKLLEEAKRVGSTQWPHG